MGIIGGIVKWILSPITGWVMGLLYSMFVRGPLALLSYVSNAFSYVSGAETDKLLFSTSIVDGKPELNFFVSDSPLKYFFIIMLGVAGALLVTFLGISMIHSFTKKKGQGPINKFGKVLVNSSIVFAIPSFFLIVLSLSGGVLSAINGGRVDISKQDITKYKTSTNVKLEQIMTSPSNMAYVFDSSHKIKGMKDEAKNKNNLGSDTSMSFDKVIQNLQDKVIWGTSDTIKELSTKSSDAFQELKNLIVRSDRQGGFYIADDFKNKILSTQRVISGLKPKKKDNNLADKVKSLETKLQTVQEAINNWVKASNILMSYEGSDKTNLQNRAIRNYRVAFETIYGRKASKDLFNINRIQTLQDLNQVIAYTINGSPGSIDDSLLILRSSLSSIEESPLVVSFYRMATGNNDSNWDRWISSFNTNGYMLIIGGALTMVAAGIMLMSVLFAVGRIFDLGLLFIVSPLVVTSTVFDDGARMKTWTNMVIAKLISIFGIVISLRLFGTLNVAFTKGFDHLSTFQGNSGFMFKQIMVTLFGLGGLLAAYKSSQTLSGIVGAGYGIMDGLQTGQTIGMIRGAASPFKAIGGGVLKGVGLSNSGVGGPTASGTAGSRSRLGNLKGTWKQRGNNLNNKLTSASAGRLGTKKARADHFDKKTENYIKKQERGTIQSRKLQSQKRLDDSVKASKTAKDNYKNNKGGRK